MSDDTSSKPTLQAELDRLASALTDQLQWVRDSHLRMVGEAMGVEDIDETPMDRWRRQGSELMMGNPIFEALGLALDTMQTQAVEMAEVAKRDGEFPLLEYEAFMNAVMAFNELTFKLQRESWSQASSVDEDTGIGNETAMRKQLVIERERARRGEQSLSVVAIALGDADSGEPLDVEIANDFVRSLSGNVRPYDQVYRADDRRFVICLPDTDIEGACIAVERISELVQEADESNQFQATFGIAPVDSDDSADDILDKASQALAKAAEDERKAFAVWAPAGE